MDGDTRRLARLCQMRAASGDLRQRLTHAAAILTEGAQVTGVHIDASVIQLAHGSIAAPMLQAPIPIGPGSGLLRVATSATTEDDQELVSAAAGAIGMAVRASAEAGGAMGQMDKILHHISDLAVILHPDGRMRSRFVASVSHEPRTPLSSITGFTDLLLSGADPLTGEQREFLGAVDRNAKRLQGIVADLLLIAKLQADKIPMEMAEFDAAAATRRALDEQRNAAASHGVRLTSRLPDRLDVHGDAERLTQVLDNLLGNAIKFSRAGGAVTVTVAPDGDDHWQMAVADTGIGVPAAEQPKLFRSFFRAANARKTPARGWGWSSARPSCNATADAYTWTAAKAPAPPSPCACPPPPRPRTRPAPTAAGPGGGHVSRILLIEDEPDITTMVRVILSRAGHQVTTADNGVRGLKAFEHTAPDLVLLDIGLPDIDGWEVLTRIRDAGDTPVILLTAYSADDDKSRGRRGGADDFVSKPFTATDLTAHVDTVLRRAPDRGPADTGRGPAGADDG